MHMRTLEQLLSLYCQLIGELAKVIDQYDIRTYPSTQILQTSRLVLRIFLR